MRYTKIALLIFGLGMILGLMVVAGELSAWERPAAAVMAFGLASIPVGLFADGKGFALIAWIAGRLRRDQHPQRRAKSRAQTSRRKKPARSASRSSTRRRSPRSSR